MAPTITKCIAASTEGETVDVTFTWAIRNISFHLNFTNKLKSPFFKTNEGTTWNCSISWDKSNRVLVGLRCGDIPDPVKIPATFKFSLHGPTGEVIITDPASKIFENEMYCRKVYSKLDQKEMLKHKTDPGDVLNLVCLVRVLHYFTLDTIPVSACKLQHDLGTILKDTQFSDVTLVVEEHHIPAHKAILAARSPVFAAMFSVDMLENNQNQVKITDMEYEVAQQLLQFIYTGNFEINPELADSLLTAADKYGLLRLKELCEQTVSKTITVSTAITALIHADRMHCKHLKSYTMTFIKANISKVLESNDWKVMVDKHPKLLHDVCRALAE